MYQRLRMTAFYCFLTLAVTTAMLWGNSYSARTLVGPYASPYSCYLSSWEGLFDLYELCSDARVPLGELRWRFESTEAARHRQSLNFASGWGMLREPQPFTFEIRKRYSTARDGRLVYSRSVVLPHWFVFLLTLTMAIACRPTPRFRCSLRDAFVLMTLVAIVAAAGSALSMLASY